jgi:hypothetical protein
MPESRSSSFTQGPWEVIHVGHNLSDEPYRVFVGKRLVGHVNTLEDARLIAAAPDLLEALKRISEATIGGAFDIVAMKNIARQAIAKVTGRDHA